MNVTLRVGDLVLYSSESTDITLKGFVIGNIYQVEGDSQILFVRAQKNHVMVPLVIRNELTDETLNFSKHECPVILTKGRI